MPRDKPKITIVTLSYNQIKNKTLHRSVKQKITV